MNKTTITLKWENINTVNLAHKIYRSEDTMYLPNLPEHIAYVDRNETEYLDVVDAGKVYYYCVSAVGDGVEEYSDIVKILSRENLSPFILTSTSVLKGNSDNTTIIVIDNLTEPYTHIYVSNDKIFLRNDNKISLYDFDGVYIKEVIISEPLNDCMVTWNDKIIIYDSDSMKVLDTDGQLIKQRDFELPIKDISKNPSGFIVGVLSGNDLSILDQDLNTLRRYFVGDNDSVIISDGYYGSYRTMGKSCRIYKGDESNTVIGNDSLLYVNVDENLRCTMIGRSNISRFDSKFNYLYSTNLSEELSNIKVDNQGSVFSYNDSLDEIYKYGGNTNIIKMNMWNVDNIIDYGIPLDPTVVSPAITKIAYTSISSSVMTNGLNLSDIDSSINNIAIDADYYDLQVTDVTYSGMGIYSINEHNTDIDLYFSGEYYDINAPIIDLDSIDAVNIEFKILEEPDVNGEIL